MKEGAGLDWGWGEAMHSEEESGVQRSGKGQCCASSGAGLRLKKERRVGGMGDSRCWSRVHHLWSPHGHGSGLGLGRIDPALDLAPLVDLIVFLAGSGAEPGEG
jgi:hypothetical protein